MMLNCNPIVPTMFALIVGLPLSSSAREDKGIPELVYQSIKQADVSALERVLVTRDDFKPGVDSIEPLSPPGDHPSTDSRMTTQALSFEQTAARRVTESVSTVRAFAARIGFDWENAKLEAAFSTSLPGEERPYGTGTGQALWLLLSMNSGEVRMAVLVNLRFTKHGTRILGPMAACDLDSSQRTALSNWHPGISEEVDRRNARLMLAGHVTKEWLQACSLEGTFESGLPSVELHLPAFFDRNVKDELLFSEDEWSGALIETEAASLVFVGQIEPPLMFEGTAEPRRIRVELTGAATESGGTMMASINGVDRVFEKARERLRTFVAPLTERVLFGGPESGYHTVRVTYTSGIVSAVEVAGKTLESDKSKNK